eukprot:TRINITY_DN13210_c1_g1_i1.p1 TRINITY_DN13210_c1_g1~~TRINITY_DN13210_c1_g1_i1.p1  ORF type:complete len:650 (-),score=76.38 TRINITY_DN13210_c1_g1_i1:340-2100(-)
MPDVTNVMVDPEGYVPWDAEQDRPVQFWLGNYSNVAGLSCARSGDLLFDWVSMKRGMTAWLREMVVSSNRVMQVYWELIRPVQHSLTNIVAFHNITTTRDCLLGMLTVRIFYMVAQSHVFRVNEVITKNIFTNDWYYYTHKFTWSILVQSGWASVIWPSIFLLSNSFGTLDPSSRWVDCEQLVGIEWLPTTIEEAEEAIVTKPELFASLHDVVHRYKPKSVEARSCPVTLAFASVVVAFAAAEPSSEMKYLDLSQRFIKQYREKNDWTFVNLLFVQWPIWQFLTAIVTRIAEETKWEENPLAKSCALLWCPDGGTPNPMSCSCEHIFPEPDFNVTACFFMVDTRKKSSLRNITSVLNARFWTLTYGINRLYAEEHGYEIEYVQPDNETHFPDRKVGWGKVKVIIDRLREYGPRRCAYGVSIDTDAYMRTSEPLAAPIQHYGLDDAKLILFSQEYHTELRPNNTFANGGFFIVRNTPEGVGLLEEWYQVPDKYPEMAHLKKQNPQGLNLCWDEKMHPMHKDSVVLAPPHLFTAPLGWFVRHNWFKDMRFEQEMMDVLLQRLQRKYGCIMCQNVYDWDDSLNFDPGWR